jgi:hypothetical protein
METCIYIIIIDPIIQRGSFDKITFVTLESGRISWPDFIHVLCPSPISIWPINRRRPHGRVLHVGVGMLCSVFGQVNIGTEYTYTFDRRFLHIALLIIP